MINKITIKRGVRIVDNSYVIKNKKNNISNIYNYLLSRSFNNFPKIIREDNNNIYYEYIDDINEPQEQKIIDLIILISILHTRTTIYKETDLDYYKYLYESINNQITDTYNYYNNLMENIEGYTYMSPSNYLIARNISKIYKSLAFAKENIQKWYKLIDDKTKVRLVTIHNNLSLDHYLKQDKSYLISWDKATRDVPIYDIISLYKHHYEDFEFSDLLNIYLNKYPLSKEEMLLFLVIIAIPDKITLSNSEYQTVLTVKRIVDYVTKTDKILKKYRIEEQTNKSQELKK